jgi:hypothetical protein
VDLNIRGHRQRPRYLSGIDGRPFLSMHFRSALFTTTLSVLTGAAALAQVPAAPAPKGSLFVYWGYNRAGYSWSNIHFNGPGYDFTLRHVEAKDRPVTFSVDGYLAPDQIWIPQYNYRVGWFLRDKWSLSLGLDHMKYVMVQDQVVRMDGWVDASRSVAFSTPEGSQDVTLTEDFLKYELTDGLNLLSVDLEHYDGLWASRNGRQRLHLFEGVHAGPVIPRSDVRLFGEGMNNVFHVAGFGVGAQLGLHFTFLDHFFARATAKGSQHFWAYQGSVVIGGQFRLGGKKKEE